MGASSRWATCCELQRGEEGNRFLLLTKSFYYLRVGARRVGVLAFLVVVVVGGFLHGGSGLRGFMELR